MFITEIVVIFLLLLLNAFFAMSEMAIVSASRPLLRQMAKQGDARAALALRLAEDSGNFLSTVQVGITLVGILAGTYGGAAIAEKAGPLLNAIALINPYGEVIAGIVVVGVITYFSVIIGELIPKQYALAHADRIAVLVAGPMYFLSTAVSPIVFIFKKSAEILMHVLGIRHGGADAVTEAEVQAVLAEGAESGAIEKSEHDMFRRIISLEDRSVKSIMTHRSEIVTLDIDDTLDEVIAKTKEDGHSRYPVMGGEPKAIVGAVLAKDILSGVAGRSNFKLKDLVREMITLPEMTNCLKALEIFKSARIHMAMIVDEYGETEGIITSADLLEAIVGILPSNYDDDEHLLIRQRPDGSYVIDGRTPIHEIQLLFGLDQITNAGDFETIAGYVVQELRKNPVEGDAFDAYGFHFEVIDMDGRRIDKILMAKDKLIEQSDTTDA